MVCRPRPYSRRPRGRPPNFEGQPTKFSTIFGGFITDSETHIAASFDGELDRYDSGEGHGSNPNAGNSNASGNSNTPDNSTTRTPFEEVRHLIMVHLDKLQPDNAGDKDEYTLTNAKANAEIKRLTRIVTECTTNASKKRAMHNRQISEVPFTPSATHIAPSH